MAMKRLTNLRRLREAVPMTQDELADAANTHRVTIWRLETGGTARPSTIRRLAQALGVPPAALWDERPEDLG